MNSVTPMFMLGVAATASASPLATRSDNGEFSPDNYSWRSDNGKFSPDNYSWRSDNGKFSPDNYSWRSDNGKFSPDASLPASP